MQRAALHTALSPHLLRYSLTMIHSCLSPVSGGRGWIRLRPERCRGEQNKAQAQLKARMYLFSEPRQFLYIVSVLCAISNSTHSPWLIGAAYLAVSFQKHLLGHMWPAFSDIPEMYCLIRTSPHLTDHSGSADLQSNCPACPLLSVLTFVQETRTFTGEQGISSWFIDPSPLGGTRGTNVLLTQGQIIPVCNFNWSKSLSHSNSRYQRMGQSCFCGL